jgi:hypothetical protein
MNFNHGKEREQKSYNTFITYISCGGEYFSIYLLRMVIFLQYTEECYMSRICFANNTVAISKSNSSIKHNVFPTIMKNIHCVATSRSCISGDKCFLRL